MKHMTSTYLVCLAIVSAPDTIVYLDYSGRATTPDQDEACHYGKDFNLAQHDANRVRDHKDVVRAYVTLVYV